jgi:hypothetical protein
MRKSLHQNKTKEYFYKILSDILYEFIDRRQIKYHKGLILQNFFFKNFLLIQRDHAVDFHER